MIQLKIIRVSETNMHSMLNFERRVNSFLATHEIKSVTITHPGSYPYFVASITYEKPENCSHNCFGVRETGEVF